MISFIYNLYNMKKGLLVILSGPSGVGKGTVREFLMRDKQVNLQYSISMTTRSPRNNERHGVEYFFVSQDEFKKLIKEDGFLEHAKFVNNYYGTPKKYVMDLLNEGKNVLVEIETKGAQQVMEKAKDLNCVSIFLLPPSLHDLEERIKNRKTESEEIIKERLEKANKEMKLKSLYDFNVINDTPERAADEILKIIKDKLNTCI